MGGKEGEWGNRTLDGIVVWNELMVALPVAAWTDGLRGCTASSNWQPPVSQVKSVSQPLCTIPPINVEGNTCNFFFLK